MSQDGLRRASPEPCHSIPRIRAEHIRGRAAEPPGMRCSWAISMVSPENPACPDSTSRRAARTTAGVRSSQFTFACRPLESAPGRAKLNSEDLTPAARQGLPRRRGATLLPEPISGVLMLAPMRE